MKLTVGPLPPAVYWRRRVALLGTLMVLLLLVAYSCSSRSDASQRARALTTTSGSPTAQPSSPDVSFSSSDATPPQINDDPQGYNDPSGTPSPSQTPSAAPSGPCADSEMTIVVGADPASSPRGTFVKFTLNIKNTSNRSCTRDVGADPQELYLQTRDNAKTKVWSSDACYPMHGSDVRTFQPGDVAKFYVVWNGRATNAGCANQQPPAAGTYSLVGRLAGKFSDPVAVTLT